MTQALIEISGTPAIPDLRFRHFSGSSDFAQMAVAIAASADADQVERVTTVEDIANAYAHLTNCDPYQDMIVAEINCEIIGYSRGWWFAEETGPHLYAFVGFLVPRWRRKGIGTVMLRWMENRLRFVADGHPTAQAKFFQAFTTQYEVGLAAMLLREGYHPARYGWQMVRPTLENIPDFPLPAGLEVRAVIPEHYRAIWEAGNQAFRDHWGFAQPTEEDYQDWLTDKTIFQPQLWQVAWDIASNQVAGQVRTFIDHAQNEKYNRQWGFTEIFARNAPFFRYGDVRAQVVRSAELTSKPQLGDRFKVD